MPPEQVDFDALGSRCTLIAAGAGAGGERLERGVAWVRQMQARLTRFEPDSEVSRLNAAAGSWTAISDELEHLLRASLHAHDVSGGLVNVAVLPALLALGYTRSLTGGPLTAEAAGPVPVPSLPDVLDVGSGRARLEAGAAIDLGGIAKGWLADRLVDRLGGNCLANLGGDLCARGPGPEGNGWPVGFGETVLLLADQGAATSSTRLRAWPAGDRQVHHLVDPRTGRESRTDLAEVSVVATDATSAEIFAKTALLLGRADAPPFLAQRCGAWRLA